MRNLVINIFLIVTLPYCAWSGEGNLFMYNAESINAQLEPLQQIENYVYSHPGIELEDLINDQSPLIIGLNLTGSSCGGIDASRSGDPLLGIPPYFWGCCLGVPGLIYVLAVTDDPYAKNRAFWGCFYHYDMWLTFWLIWYYLGYY